jgi:hypothetical protein
MTIRIEIVRETVGTLHPRCIEIPREEIRMVHLFKRIGIAMLLLASPTLADPLPVAKPPGPGGGCPYGYFSSGSFCVPSQGAQDAIAKPPGATCPNSWTSSGSYCLRSGR